MYGRGGGFGVEEMHMDVARRLRDFLNSAVPNAKLSRASSAPNKTADGKASA